MSSGDPASSEGYPGQSFVGETDTEMILLQHDLDVFLDPTIDLSVHSQLVLPTYFYRRLGYNLPRLDDEFLNGLDQTVEDKRQRIVPQLAMTTDELVKVGRKASRTFPEHFNPDIDPVYVDEKITSAKARNSLRYIGRTGKYLDQTGYFDFVLGLGQSIEDPSNQSYWLFAAMDIDFQPAGETTARELIGKIGPYLTMEALIIINLLRKIKGQTIEQPQLDLVNALVFASPEDKEPEAVVGVGTQPETGQIVMVAVPADEVRNDLGVRSARSIL